MRSKLHHMRRTRATALEGSSRWKLEGSIINRILKDTQTTGTDHSSRLTIMTYAQAPPRNIPTRAIHKRDSRPSLPNANQLDKVGRTRPFQLDIGKLQLQLQLQHGYLYLQPQMAHTYYQICSPSDMIYTTPKPDGIRRRTCRYATSKRHSPKAPDIMRSRHNEYRDQRTSG